MSTTQSSYALISNQTKVVTIASGKGGAGKTVLALALSRLINVRETLNSCAVLDLDFHVKGFTLLWYKNLRDLETERFSLYDYFIGQRSLPPEWEAPGVHKTKVIPSYQHIRTPPDYDAIAGIQFKDVLSKLKDLLESLEGKASFVIIDTRAGIDNYCLAASVLSDLTIIVSEQDRISFRACYDLQTQIMLFARKAEPASLGVKGNLPFYVYNKVVDPRLIVDEVTHLPPIAFDREFFEDVQAKTDRILEPKHLNRRRFMRDISKTWKRAIQELGIGEEKAQTRHPFRSILELYVELVRRTFQALSQPLTLGLVSSLFLAFLMFSLYAGRQTRLLEAQILALQQSEHAAKQERTIALMRRLEEKDMRAKLMDTYAYLSQDESIEQKIKRIERDPKVSEDLWWVLSFFEDLGYEYNRGLLDNALVRDRAGRLIRQYYEAASLWIVHRRGQREHPGLYKEFQTMAEDITKPVFLR